MAWIANRLALRSVVYIEYHRTMSSAALREANDYLRIEKGLRGPETRENRGTADIYPSIPVKCIVSSHTPSCRCILSSFPDIRYVVEAHKWRNSPLQAQMRSTFLCM